jgi:hypothetical protein
LPSPGSTFAERSQSKKDLLELIGAKNSFKAKAIASHGARRMSGPSNWASETTKPRRLDLPELPVKGVLAAAAAAAGSKRDLPSVAI